MDLSTAKRIVAEWLEEWQPPRRAGKTFFMFQTIWDLIREGVCERGDIRSGGLFCRAARDSTINLDRVPPLVQRWISREREDGSESR